MRPFGCVLLSCLLLAGCRTAEPQSVATSVAGADVAAGPQSEETRAPEGRSRLERMRESVSVQFFTGLEQVAKVVAFPFQAALTGLYVLLFPIVGYGPGGHG